MFCFYEALFTAFFLSGNEATDDVPLFWGIVCGFFLIKFWCSDAEFYGMIAISPRKNAFLRQKNERKDFI